MKKLTKEQAVILSGFTGIMMCNEFADLQQEVDKRIGYPTFTHQYGHPIFVEQVKELFRKDFFALIPNQIGK
jgi:hypothetical protein